MAGVARGTPSIFLQVLVKRVQSVETEGVSQSNKWENCHLFAGDGGWVAVFLLRQCFLPEERRRQAVYLMLDNYDSFTQMLVSYFRELGVRMDTYENDGIDAKTVRDMDDAGLLRGIVVSPGPKSPKECGNCGDIVRLAARRRIPLLGVCLGHQVIADVFGARVTRGKRPMHGKVTAIRHNNQGLFKALPETFEVVRYHSLVVDDDELPHFFSVDARSEDGAIMALRHRELPLYGVQFHPEAARTQYGHELLSRFVVCCETAR